MAVRIDRRHEEPMPALPPPPGEERRERPRHCMVVHTYYPRVAPRTQRQAERLVEAGYDVDVICLREEGEPARERHRGVEVHRLPVGLDKSSLSRQFTAYLRFFVRAFVRLTRLNARRRYASIHVHNLPDFLVLTALVPKLRGVPVILDLHDVMPEFFAGRFGSRRPILGWLIRLQERISCRFADHVITVSEGWRQALIERGVPASKCSVTMNVADERVFAPVPVREPTAGFGLTFHGTVEYRYGLDLAIRAVASLKDELPDLSLMILGRGNHLDALIALAGSLGVQDRIRFRPEAVPREELPGIIASADVGIVPYRNDVFTDGIIPTKIMEYAAMGMPCIAARTSAIQDYFSDTIVELFEPGDVEDLARAIRRLHDDPARRDELAAGGPRFTDRFNWEQEGARFVGLVDRLNGRAAARSRVEGARMP